MNRYYERELDAMAAALNGRFRKTHERFREMYSLDVHPVARMLLTGLLAWCLWPATAQAQAYPCPGPGPGERMVGMMPGGQGVGSVPMCVRDGSPAPAQQPQRKIYLTREQQAALFSKNPTKVDPALLEEALKEGGLLGWNIFQEGEPPIPGQKCNAMWVNASGTITIGTTRGLDDPALLIYNSIKIPKSKWQVPITAHINENGKESDIQGVHYTFPNSDFGSILFSLRSLKAAIGDMKDTGRVKIEVEGKEMIDITWKNGLEAKKKLEQCAKSQPY